MTKNSRLKEISRINKIAVPILITFITSLFFNIGDQAIIGRTSLNGYAAVSVVANLLYAITGTLGIISLSLNIVGSKLIGEDDHEGYGNLFGTSLALAIIIGVSFEILCLVFGKGILRYGFNLNGEVLVFAYQYLAIAGAGLLLNTFLFIYSSYFKTIEKTSILFVVSIIGNCINLTLDYVLVFGKFGFPKLGVTGAAIGTIIGLLCEVLIYIYFAKKNITFKYAIRIKFAYLKKILKSYIPLVGQDFIESTAFIIVITALLASIGTLAIGAYNLVYTILQIVILPIYAYGTAVITVIAKTQRKEDIQFRRRVPVLTIMMLIGILSLFAAIVMINSRMICSIITNNKSLLDAASRLLLLGLIIQLPNIVNQVYKYSLNAVGDEKWVFYCHSIISTSSLAVIYYFSILFEDRINGIFYGLGLNYALLGIAFYLRYQYLLKLGSGKEIIIIGTEEN